VSFSQVNGKRTKMDETIVTLLNTMIALAILLGLGLIIFIGPLVILSLIYQALTKAYRFIRSIFFVTTYRYKNSDQNAPIYSLAC